VDDRPTQETPMAGFSLWAPLGAVAALAAVEPPPFPDPEACARRLHQVADGQGIPLRSGERLVSDRQGRLRRDLAAPGEVRLYYLVDRRIGGCPVPVVSPARLEEANRAIGRDLARERR
jgi:hypothetical protein